MGHFGAPPPMPGGYGAASPPLPVAPPGSYSRPPFGLQSGPSFLNPFGESQLSVQEIADKARQLQQKIDDNAEQEKASLRSAAEQKHQEIERHAAELSRHAATSIEAYKSAQLQAAERQKAYQQAVVRQQAEQAKRLIDQQAAQAIAAVEARDRHMDIHRQQQELGRHTAMTGAYFADPSGYMSPAPPGFAAGPSPFPGARADSFGTAASHLAGPTHPPVQLPSRDHGPVTATEAARHGSIGAAVAAQLRGSESYEGLRPMPPMGSRIPPTAGSMAGGAVEPPWGASLPPLQEPPWDASLHGSQAFAVARGGTAY